MISQHTAKVITLNLIDNYGLRAARLALTDWQHYGKYGSLPVGAVLPHPSLGTGEALLANVNELIAAWWNHRDARAV